MLNAFTEVQDRYVLFRQTMAASKRNQALPSALVARQSLNDEELVSTTVTPGVISPHYQQHHIDRLWL